MKLIHFTHPDAYKLICADGQIDLEGCNAKFGCDSMSREKRRIIYKTIGRHVWLTQSTAALTATSNEVALHFNSDKINAVRWSDFKKKFRNSKSKQHMVDAFDESARRLGDNTNDYWLVSKPISLTNLIKE